jgi:hypothetical protein
LSDFAFGKKHLEDFVPEDLFEVFSLETRGNPEHALAIKTAIRTQNVKVRVESQEIPKALDGNDGAGDRHLLWDDGLEKHFQRLPCTSTQFGKESSVIEEVSPEDLWYAENEMPVRYGLEDFFTEPFPEFHHPFLMTRGAEVAALTREGQEILVAAVFASHPGEAVMEDAAIEVTVNNLFDIRTQKTILFGKTVVINLFKSLKMILNTLIILRFLWLARAIYRRDIGHDRFSFGSKSRLPDEEYCKFN